MSEPLAAAASAKLWLPQLCFVATHIAIARLLINTAILMQ